MHSSTPSYNYTIPHQSYPLKHQSTKIQTYPPEIIKHYVQNQSSYLDYFNCKYCKKQFVVRGDSTIDQMIWHSQTQHGRHVNAKRYSLQQKMDNLRPPPKYLNKYQHLNIVSDRWLDRLILDDYPIAKIRDNIFTRLASDSGQFMRQAEKRTNKLIAAKQAIIKFLPHLPLHYLPEQVINLISKRFNISLEGAGLFMRRYTWPFVKSSEMYQKLNDINVDVRRYKQNNIDSVVVIANQRMKLFYEKYGDAINVQFRFIPLKRSHSGMHYNIGLFTGQDTNLRQVIFSIALINGYYHKNVKLCIEFFLQIMGDKQPQIFITDHSKMIQMVLFEIKRKKRYNFKHIVNWYYTIQKLKVQLANQFQYRQNLSKFSTALSSLSFQQYSNILSEIKRNGRINPAAISSFQKNSYKCCICNIDPVFVGFGVQEDRVLYITKAVQQEFQYHSRVGMSFTLAFRLEHSWNSLSMTQIQLIEHKKISSCQVKQIRYLAKNLQKNIFTKFYYLYNRSLTQLQIVGRDPLNLIYRIFDRSKPLRSSNYFVHFDIKSNCWRCSCCLIYWSGIPCQHLIKIVRFFRGSITFYMNSRWFINGIVDGQFIPEFEEDPQDNSNLIIKDQQENTQKQKQSIEIDIKNQKTHINKEQKEQKQLKVPQSTQQNRNSPKIQQQKEKEIKQKNQQQKIEN